MPKQPSDQGFNRFEFRPGVGGFPRWGGIDRSTDPATIPLNSFWTAENVRITPEGVISRGGMTQQADFSGFSSSAIVTGIYDTKFAEASPGDGDTPGDNSGAGSFITSHSGYSYTLARGAGGDPSDEYRNSGTGGVFGLLQLHAPPSETFFSETNFLRLVEIPWSNTTSTKLLGETNHKSFIYTRYKGYLLGACCEDNTLKLIKWSVADPELKSTVTPGAYAVRHHAKYKQTVLATVSLTSPDIPGAFWGHFTENNAPVVYFGMAKSGKLYRWDDTSLTLDGTPGVGLDLVINYNEKMVLVGKNYIKVRASAGSYGSSLLPTGAGITAGTYVTRTYGTGSFQYLIRTAAPTGDLDTAAFSFIPTAYAIFENNLYISCGFYNIALGSGYGGVYKYTGSGNATLFDVCRGSLGTDNGYGVMGINVANYPFNDMSTTAGQAADSSPGNKLFWLSSIGVNGSSGLGVYDPAGNGGAGTFLSNRMDTPVHQYGFVSGSETHWPCGQLYQHSQGLLYSRAYTNGSTDKRNIYTAIRTDVKWTSPRQSVVTDAYRTVASDNLHANFWTSRLLI